MRDVLLNLTMSLDGYIAGFDGDIDWLLPMPENLPEGYAELLESIDTLVMGSATYETSLALEGGEEFLADKTVFVFTSQRDLEPLPSVTFIKQDPVQFLSDLKRSEGKTIWVYGGGQIASLLSDAGLIDDYLIAIQPILLGDGIPLWHKGMAPLSLELQYARPWDDGIVELRYRKRS